MGVSLFTLASERGNRETKTRGEWGDKGKTCRGWSQVFAHPLFCFLRGTEGPLVFFSFLFLFIFLFYLAECWVGEVEREGSSGQAGNVRSLSGAAWSAPRGSSTRFMEAVVTFRRGMGKTPRLLLRGWV